MTPPRTESFAETMLQVETLNIIKISRQRDTGEDIENTLKAREKAPKSKADNPEREKHPRNK